MEGGKRFHINIDIANALRWSDRKLEGMLCDAETKEVLSPEQIRTFFRQLLQKGQTCFTGCDNTKSDGSCAGHPITSD